MRKPKKAPPWTALTEEPKYAVSCLRERRGIYAECEGVWKPRIMVDRDAENLPGFNALMYHETLHSYELHALFGVFVLAAGAISFACGMVLQAPVLLIGGSLSSLLMFAWWKREAEVRADAIALYYAGLQEFRAFLLFTGIPRTRWGRWLYTHNRETREARAWNRCLRNRWLDRDARR